MRITSSGLTAPYLRFVAPHYVRISGRDPYKENSTINGFPAEPSLGLGVQFSVILVTKPPYIIQYIFLYLLVSNV